MRVAEMKKNALDQLRNLGRQAAKVEKSQGQGSDEYTRARHWVDAQREAYVNIKLVTYVEATCAIHEGYEQVFCSK